MVYICGYISFYKYLQKTEADTGFSERGGGGGGVGMDISYLTFRSGTCSARIKHQQPKR